MLFAPHRTRPDMMRQHNHGCVVYRGGEGGPRVIMAIAGLPRGLLVREEAGSGQMGALDYAAIVWSCSLIFLRIW